MKFVSRYNGVGAYHIRKHILVDMEAVRQSVDLSTSSDNKPSADSLAAQNIHRSPEGYMNSLLDDIAARCRPCKNGRITKTVCILRFIFSSVH